MNTGAVCIHKYRHLQQAHTVLLAAPAMSFKLTMGMSPF